jgi:general secretion pathway protein G
VKKAFTMIELIFVIVILGILASVAIPKLAATRDDAMVVRQQANLKVVISEIMTTVLAKGSADDNLTDISVALKTMVSNGMASVIANKVNIKSGSQDDCIVLDVNSSSDIIINIVYNTATDSSCKSFQKLADLDSYKLKIRGQNVVY